MCGWIGVEISRSRVRTPGKAGYGLWRVRGSEHIAGGRSASAPVVGGPPVHYRVTEWTAYAFTLDDIARAAGSAIQRGTPTGPGSMLMCGWIDGQGRAVTVPTRWTQAYRGRRDLGVACEYDTNGDGDCARMTCARCHPELHPAPVGAPLTDRQRQREMNAAFQAEHLERRAHGKATYHAAKLARNPQRRNPEA